MSREINLRDYQQKVHDATIEHFKRRDAPQTPAVIDATVGSGKSICIAAAAKHVADRGGRALCLSRQGELCEQNSDAAHAYGCRNSIYSASLGLKSTFYPVIFATEGTVARALSEPGFQEKFDLILIDEMQMVDYDNHESQFMRIILHCQKINPKVRIAGYSGSPFRGMNSVIGHFWKEIIGQISTDLLTDRGYLAPLNFAYPDDETAELDFSEMDLKGEHSGNDYKEEDLDRILQGEVHKTIAICHDMVKRGREIEGGVLIFGGSKLHTEQIKYGLELAGAAPEEIRIVTDDTPNKERQEARKAAISGKCKFFVNIGVCSTGWNVPYWSSIAYLRPVGSLVFLIQSLGRVLRPYLTDEESELFNSPDATTEDRLAILAGSRKTSAEAWDYAGVFDRLGHLYNSPVLEQAALEKSKREGKLIECPKCNTVNSEHARRCIGVDHTSPDGRCELFWSSQECRKCGTKNDVTAQECRSCKAMLRDPANALMNKAYSDAELTAVISMDVVATRNDGILIKYQVAQPHEELGHPVEFYSLKSDAGKRIWFNKFLKVHIRDPGWSRRAYGMGSTACMKNQAMFDVPTHIAYRINDKKKFVIGKKQFKSGRIEDAQT